MNTKVIQRYKLSAHGRLNCETNLTKTTDIMKVLLCNGHEEGAFYTISAMLISYSKYGQK